MTSKYVVIAFLVIALQGCVNHRIDTFPKWCEQISGVDLERKYGRIWAVGFSVSYDAEAIRDDFTEFLNAAHLERVGDRADVMAWRVGTELHLVNLSSFFVVSANEVIEEWRNGIEVHKGQGHDNPADVCLYGTLTSMFDSLHMHTLEADSFGQMTTDTVTLIPTNREIWLGGRQL